MAKITLLLWFLLSIGPNVNANPIANDGIENESSWLTRLQDCFFNDASEDVGHFFLTRLINCWPNTTTAAITSSESSTKQFLIAGGETSWKKDLATEVIDVQSNSNVTSSFGNIPSSRDYPVGGLLGSTPILCGGYNGNFDYDYQDSCFTLKDSQWRQTHKMTTKRSESANVQINASTLWILGGWNGDDRLDSSEFVELDSTVGKPGPKLPYAVSFHCAVQYSKDKVYMIGGHGSSTLNKVLIFNPMNDFTHIEGPPLISKRGGHACGLMSNGQQSKIVVAGGNNGNDALSSVEIFDPTANNWIPGPPLPYKLDISAMATSPDGGGVILFGGVNRDKHAEEDTILELRYGSDKWTKLPQKLKQPRSRHVVIPITQS